MFDTLPCSLRELRTRLGATQAEMAEAMCVNRSNYQDMEAGWYKLKPIHVRAALFAAFIIRSQDPAYLDLAEALKHLLDEVTCEPGHPGSSAQDSVSRLRL